MKKSVIILIAVVAVIIIWAISAYNGLVSMDENVSSQWANVETQYQRRADLIPNLVNTVKGYASHEKETLEGVVEARSKATQIKVDANDLTPEKLAEYQKAQGAVTSALGKLLAITENYPDLKANQNFLELQAQLEGTENRINVARKNFNNAAQAYNTSIRHFPQKHLCFCIRLRETYLFRSRRRNGKSTGSKILIGHTHFFSQAMIVNARSYPKKEIVFK